MNHLLINNEVWNIKRHEDYMSLDIYFTVVRELDKKKIILKDISSLFNKLDDRDKIDYLVQRIIYILAQENINDNLIVKKENKIDTIIGLLQEISSKLGE